MNTPAHQTHCFPHSVTHNAVNTPAHQTHCFPHSVTCNAVNTPAHQTHCFPHSVTHNAVNTPAHQVHCAVEMIIAYSMEMLNTSLAVDVLKRYAMPCPLILPAAERFVPSVYYATHFSSF